MKKYIYPLAITATLLATTACSDDEVNAVDQPIPDSQKEMISFSLSDGAASTRAGFTGADTYIVMRIQSNKRGGTVADVKYTKTEALAKKDATGGEAGYSDVSFNTSTSADPGNSSDNMRYWDDAYGRNSLLSVYAVAIPDGGSTITGNNQTLTSLIAAGADPASAWGGTATNTIAWNVEITAQTLGVSGTNAPTGTINKEDLVYSNNIQQNGENGIYRWDYSSGDYTPGKTGAKTHANGQMLFFQNGMTATDAATKELSSAPGHFDRGHLVFNHALSRMTVTLVEGEGFDKTSANKDNDFKFEGSTNIKLVNMNTAGTLDIKAGTWSVTTSNGTIAKMAPSESGYTTAAGTYVAQMLPGLVIADGSDDNVMEFTIDNNTYYVTKDMLFDALYENAGTGTGKNGLPKFKADNTTKIDQYIMEQGKNYTFSITVKKTAISAITATLVDWDEIKGSTEINNAHITVTTNKFSGTDYKECKDLVLLRHNETLSEIVTSAPGTDTYVQYQGSYGEAQVLNASSQYNNTTNKWTTNWYFEDNKTAYHIRSINAKAYGSSGNNVTTPTTDGTKTYFEMVNGKQEEADYHWGAPMKSGANLVYSTSDGYKSSLHQGILSTESDINITELHMMSKINVVLTTTNGADAVQFRKGSGTDSDPYKYAAVEITNLYSEAQVDMGIGLVTPKTIAATSGMTVPAADKYYKKEGTAGSETDDITTTQPFTWSVVPQELKRSSGETPYVGITITLPDGNKYFIIEKLSDILVSSVSGFNPNHTASTTGSPQKIDRWYPNHSYTYTIKLTKTKIENITASVAEWVTVTAGSTNIDLEK